MPSQKFYVESILLRVHSIYDLTRQIIDALQSLPGTKIPITKFLVSPSEMNEWIEKHGLPKGIEYSISENRITVKLEEDALRKAARVVMEKEFFTAVIKELTTLLPGEVFSMSHNEPHTLHGEFTGDLAASDGQIDRQGSTSPSIVLLVDNTLPSIMKDAVKWLHGGEGKTKTVLGILIDEESAPAECPWGLQPENIVEMDMEDLRAHIYNWHQEKKRPIIGTITAKLFIIAEKEISHPREPLLASWTCTFGPREIFVDRHSHHKPTGNASYRHPELSGVDIHDGEYVDLPFTELEAGIDAAIPEFERDRALLMATEGVNWAFRQIINP